MPAKPPAAPAIGCRTHLVPGCGDARVIQCTDPEGHYRTVYAYRDDVRSDLAYHDSRAHPAVTTTESGMVMDGSITGIVGDIRDTRALNRFFLTFNGHIVYFDHDDTDDASIHPPDPAGATPVLSTGGLMGADCAALPSAPPARRCRRRRRTSQATTRRSRSSTSSSRRRPTRRRRRCCLRPSRLPARRRRRRRRRPRRRRNRPRQGRRRRRRRPRRRP